jgi:hypothetical protein
MPEILKTVMLQQMFRLMRVAMMNSVKGVSDERLIKKNRGTKKKINFQEKALHLEKRKIKLMEEIIFIAVPCNSP